MKIARFVQQTTRHRPLNFGTRFLSTPSTQLKASSAFLAVGTGIALSTPYLFAESPSVDYAAVRKDIADSLDQDDHDDGSLGPIFVRLAWHTSGTFDKVCGNGGSNGSRQRFEPECKWDANAGLGLARAALDKIKARHPGISYSDLWTLAGAVAIEEMGGPKIGWRSGRSDAPDGKSTVPDGRLPDGDKGAAHLRTIFYKMGFNDQEIVALAGAHSLGRCHPGSSGWDGPWTRAPTTFSNLYFQELMNNTWTLKKWNGPPQYEDPTGDLMMLPADIAFVEDKSFKTWTAIYAQDEERFFKDFAAAFQKLEEAGCRFNDEDSFTPFVTLAGLVGFALFKGA